MSSAPVLSGIHHVTAITADAQANIDFYRGVLGLRLVKMTVNFDDPGSYHLYYGDELGRPGTIMTFFAWPGGRKGEVGPPQATVTSFAVPRGALAFWADRLASSKVDALPAFKRFGDDVLSFTDPDGLGIEIIETENPGGQPWAAGPVPADSAIVGFHGVTIAEEGYESTARLLTDVMGYTLEQREDNRFRYRTANADGVARTIDLMCTPDARRGRMGTGVVHHVAFRTPNDAEQEKWLELLRDMGFNSSPVMDRNYFHSIYFREPGGVLFEIATDSPGFTIDEPAAELGTHLMLPAQYEHMRERIQQKLPPVKVPGVASRD
jgi:catechol 2,3-dioxygenase-like lactoylglutathione lyase family enzyme